MEKLVTEINLADFASEFRFDYWRTENEHRFFTVKQGVGKYVGRWAVLDGLHVWNGEFWDPNARGWDMYRYERNEALDAAVKLAFEKNQEVVGQMERRYPGKFRGSRYDKAVQE